MKIIEPSVELIDEINSEQILAKLEQQGVIDFRDATFGIVFTRFGKENFSPLYALKDFVKIEVIGHITEDEQ